MEANHDTEALFSLLYLRSCLAAEPGLDDFFDVNHIESIARGTLAIDLDLDLRKLAQPVDE